MKIKVLYEDPNILAIDKPAGISVHGDGRSKEKTIMDWVNKNYPKMKNVGEPMFVEHKGESIEIKRPGVVHRLDRDTSGVMLLAKNQKTYEFLKEQFQERAVKKIYHTIVSGWLREDRGVINRKIGRSPSDFRKYSASRGARGEMREAITQYKVLKRIEIPQKFTYLEVMPKTGRTHQIRVHMKAIDHPVVGDVLYNPYGLYPKGIKRMALHAKSIEFVGTKGKIIKIESPLPKEFENILK